MSDRSRHQGRGAGGAEYAQAGQPWKACGDNFLHWLPEIIDRHLAVSVTEYQVALDGGKNPIHLPSDVPGRFLDSNSFNCAALFALCRRATSIDKLGVYIVNGIFHILIDKVTQQH